MKVLFPSYRFAWLQAPSLLQAPSQLPTLLLTLLLSLASPFPALAQADTASQAELDQMLAPIALYPDTVLSHVLIASTYPLEVVQAARWSRNHPDLKGQAAVEAVEDKDWDPSVKALVAFPQLLAQMDEDLEWTQRLGETFLAQEDQVATTIQRLRDRAYAEGNLESSEQIEVYREADHIIIEPAVREVVYVPWYDTRMVYGSWWWPAYPPVYWVYHDRWGHPYHYHSYSGFHWGAGIRISNWFYFSTFHWPRRIVVVDHHHHHYRHFDSGHRLARYENASHWTHDPHHRRSVGYRNKALQHRFEQPRQQRLGVQVRNDAHSPDDRHWKSGSHSGRQLAHQQSSPDRRRIEPQRNDNWDRFIIRYPDARERLRGRNDITPHDNHRGDRHHFRDDHRGHDRDRQHDKHRDGNHRDDSHRGGQHRDHDRSGLHSKALVNRDERRDRPGLKVNSSSRHDDHRGNRHSSVTHRF